MGQQAGQGDAAVGGFSGGVDHGSDDDFHLQSTTASFHGKPKCAASIVIIPNFFEAVKFLILERSKIKLSTLF